MGVSSGRKGSKARGSVHTTTSDTTTTDTTGDDEGLRKVKVGDKVIAVRVT